MLSNVRNASLVRIWKGVEIPETRGICLGRSQPVRSPSDQTEISNPLPKQTILWNIDSSRQGCHYFLFEGMPIPNLAEHPPTRASPLLPRLLAEVPTLPVFSHWSPPVRFAICSLSGLLLLEASGVWSPIDVVKMPRAGVLQNGLLKQEETEVPQKREIFLGKCDSACS